MKSQEVEHRDQAPTSNVVTITFGDLDLAQARELQQ
jgi:hypothetical protein